MPEEGAERAVLQPLATEWKHLQAFLETILLSVSKAGTELPTPTFVSVTTTAHSSDTCFAHDALAFLVALNSLLPRSGLHF